MSRLIKKEDVIAVAKGFAFTFAEERQRYMDFLEYCIDNAPTAYDLDKVVRELEEESYDYVDYHDKRVYTIDLEDAIEIVKRGGVNV